MEGTSLPARSQRRTAAAIAILALLALLGPAAGRALADPASQWPVGGPALSTAVGIAEAHWGTIPCGGRFTIAWTRLARGVNASSQWSNPVDDYRQPSRNTDCTVQLNDALDYWDWPMLCTIVVHELGHLSGQQHSSDPADVMFAYYSTPLAECAATPEPAPGPPTPAPPAAAPVPAAAPAAATRRVAKPRKVRARRGGASRARG